MHEGVYWLMPDSESFVGALRMYREQASVHLYAHMLQGACLSTKASVNKVMMPSHWMMAPNLRSMLPPRMHQKDTWVPRLIC